MLWGMKPILQQQACLMLDNDADEAKPAEFVIIRIGRWTNTR